MCMCMHVCRVWTCAKLWKSDDNFWEWFLLSTNDLSWFLLCCILQATWPVSFWMIRSSLPPILRRSPEIRDVGHLIQLSSWVLGIELSLSGKCFYPVKPNPQSFFNLSINNKYQNPDYYNIFMCLTVFYVFIYLCIYILYIYNCLIFIFIYFI